MSSKDNHDERVLARTKLDRRNMLLAGGTLAAASALKSTPSSAEQAGASGAYSNSAIAMMPPGAALASKQERALGVKIARAMLSGPRPITKDATVAEMGADGNLVVLRQGTNDWVCFPGDDNEIGNVPMCANPMGL